MTTDERLESLVRDQARRAFGLALALCGQAADADDLLQRAVLVAARKRAAIPTAGAWPWFARIIALEARNLRRERRREHSQEEPMASPDPRSPDPVDQTIDRELARTLRQELARLPEDQREALVLVHVSGMTYREAATALGLAPATLNQRVKDAVLVLRRRLGLGETALCAALTGLDFGPPPGGFEVAIARWLGTARSAAAIGKASVIGGLIVSKKLMVVAAVLLVVAAVGAWAEFGRDDGDGLRPTRGSEPVAATGESARARRSNEVEAEASGTTLSAGTVLYGGISGRVLDTAGRPRAGVELQLAGGSQDEILARASSDAEGRYRVELRLDPARAAARIDLVLAAVDHELIGSRRDRLWLEPGLELEGVDLVVTRPGAVAGRLVASHDSTPVAGAKIELGRVENAAEGLSHRPGGLAAVTDAEGRFRLAGLPPGRLGLHVLLGDGAEATWLPIAPESGDLVLAEGEERAEVELRVAIGRLDFRLDQAPGAPVSVFRTDGSFMVQLASFPDLGTGPYRVRGLDHRVDSIYILSSGWAGRQVDFRPRPGTVVDLGVVALERQAEAGGQVIDAAGRPVDRAIVVIRSRDGRRQSVVQSGPDGRFRCGWPRAMATTITVSHRDHPRLEVDCDLEPGDQDLILRLEPGATIRGRVTLAGRTPTAAERGADGRARPLVVGVLGPDDHLPPDDDDVRRGDRRVETDADGRFTIVGVGADETVVAAAYDGRVVWKDGLDLGAGEIELDLGRGAIVTGLVLEDGRPQAGVDLRLSRRPQELRSDGDDLRARSDAEGRYRFEGVPAGTWYLKRQGETMLVGGELAAREVSPRDGDLVERDLVVAAATSPLAGRILVAGRPGFATALLVRPGLPMPVSRAAVDEAGRFQFGRIDEGAYYLWFTDDLYDPTLLHREAVTITTGSPVRIERDLDGAGLAGNLAGAEQATISLRPVLEESLGADGVARYAVLTLKAKAGRFERAGLVAGRYLMEVSAEGKAPWSRELEIRGQIDLEVDLDRRGGDLELVVGRPEGFRPEDRGGNFLDDLMVVRVLDQEGHELGVLDESRYLPLAEHASRKLSLEPGRYRLQILGKLVETMTMEVEIVAGECLRRELSPRRAAEYRLKLDGEGLDAAALGRLKLAVFAADGSRVEAIDLALAAGAQDQVALARGELRVLPLAAGRYRILVEVPGFEAIEKEVVLGTSEVATGSLRLVRRP